MIADRGLLARYLRQRRALGERELFLDGLTAREALACAAGEVVFPVEPPPPPPLLNGAATPLVQLGERVSGCTACRLSEGRRSVVFGEGNPQAQLVVIGEAPGAEEDRTGRPFVGQAGKLLDLLLAAVGLPRSEVYICNVLKCRPPGNRDPQPDEVASCAAHLREQLDLIGPKALLAAGRFAAQTLVGTDAPISKLRGRVHSVRGVPLVATYHPAYLLRSPQWTRSAWGDLQLLRQVLDEQV
jgi:uracil-DNA glycosylase